MKPFKLLSRINKLEEFRKHVTEGKQLNCTSEGVMTLDAISISMICVITKLKSKKTRHQRKRVKKFILNAITEGIKESRNEI